MLKQVIRNHFDNGGDPAAFRRLCVETKSLIRPPVKKAPAAFRRLCVETLISIHPVENVLPAAFRRLCVETMADLYTITLSGQPPSGGCVLKR